MLFLLYYIVYISSSELGADVELPANLTRTSLKARAFTPSLDLSCHNVQVDLFSTRQAITLFPSVHLSVCSSDQVAPFALRSTCLRCLRISKTDLIPHTFPHSICPDNYVHLLQFSAERSSEHFIFAIKNIFSRKKKQQTLKLCKEKRS